MSKIGMVTLLGRLLGSKLHGRPEIIRLKNHHSAPLLEALISYQHEDPMPFNTPGHKRGQGVLPEMSVPLTPDVFAHDIPLLGGVDDRQMSKQTLVKAQMLAADAWGAETTLFSDQGSITVQAALSAVAAPGEKVLISRNIHKSAISGVILSGVIPVFIHPPLDPLWDIAHVITPEKINHALDWNPEARAVLLVSPTCFGVVGDIPAIARVCHRHGVPLLVDEAWGALFPFHPDLPPPALVSGADLALTSIHKTLIGLQGASAIHLRGKRISKERLVLAVDLIQSTSPSSLVLASIDAARRQFALQGNEIISRMLELASQLRNRFRTIPGLRVLGREILGQPGAIDLDPTKITLDVSELGISGYAAATWLRQETRVTVQLGDDRRVLAVLSAADDVYTISRIADGMKTLAEVQNRTPLTGTRLPPLKSLATDLAMPPRDAFFAATQTIPLARSEGRISAETISPYPPGIPILCPGEQITRSIIEYLQQGVAGGMYVAGVSDSSLETIRVVA